MEFLNQSGVCGHYNFARISARLVFAFQFFHLPSSWRWEISGGENTPRYF
jgi:hypothetical protein